MIDIQAKIHDQYTIEFKVGYIARLKLPKSDFVMNTWIFLPDNLDINRRSYSKDMFYHDVRSYMRLITPVYALGDLAQADNLPFRLLMKVCRKMVDEKSEQTSADFESQSKMYASIYKSALRNAYRNISLHKNEEVLVACRELVDSVSKFLSLYRSQFSVLKDMDDELCEYFQCMDEFISNVTEQHLFLLSDYLKENHPEVWNKLRSDVFAVLDGEIEYKKSMHYSYVDRYASDENCEFVHNAGLLKKYAESNLYLKARKRQNTFLIEQIAFMFAAGIAMIFATVIAFSFQQTFGNFTLPLFIALVVSYMFKDRIKDLIRFYFAHKLGGKLYDYKISMSIHNRKIGWSKEGFDYITAGKLPEKVSEKRQRTSLLEARRGIDEQIILYRKKLHLHRKNVNRISEYPLLGVNDIIRYNLFEFTKKMDDSKMPVYANLGNGEYERIDAKKVYYINYVIQCRYQDVTTDYYRYRIMMSKKGIESIEKLD